jgi:hypothetical protein
MNIAKAVVVLGLSLALAAGCRKEMQKDQVQSGDISAAGEYSLTETYEVTGGPQKGMKGESVYTLLLRRDGNGTHVVLENFANAYSVQAELKNDSLFIRKQQFPYTTDSVTIRGAGKVSGSAITIDYSSGGPAGQIKGICVGVKMR